MVAVLLLLLLTSAGQEGTRTPDLPFPARARVGALRLPMPLAVTVTGPVWTDEVAGGKRRAGGGGSGRAGGQQGNRATGQQGLWCRLATILKPLKKHGLTRCCCPYLQPLPCHGDSRTQHAGGRSQHACARHCEVVHELPQKEGESMFREMSPVVCMPASCDTNMDAWGSPLPIRFSTVPRRIAMLLPLQQVGLGVRHAAERVLHVLHGQHAT